MAHDADATATSIYSEQYMVSEHLRYLAALKAKGDEDAVNRYCLDAAPALALASGANRARDDEPVYLKYLRLCRPADHAALVRSMELTRARVESSSGARRGGKRKRAPVPDSGAEDAAAECRKCGGQVESDGRSGDVLCSSCGLVHGPTIMREEVRAFERATYRSKQLYERCNHLQNKLEFVTGEKLVHISPEVIDGVRRRLVAEKGEAGMKSSATLQDFRDALKKTQQFLNKKPGHVQTSKYFDNIVQIANQICGRRRFGIRIDPATQREIARRFRIVDEVFNKYKGEHWPERSSMFSYNYIIFKLIQLHKPDLSDIIEYFPVPKIKNNMVSCDNFWRVVMAAPECRPWGRFIP